MATFDLAENTEMNLYVSPMSPPVRGVLLTVAALGLKPTINIVDTHAGEHLTPQFIAMNPQHTIPTLNDKGFIIWESHAINAYLVSQYGPPTCTLYPKDPKQRAVVDQRMHFHTGTVQKAVGKVVYPLMQPNPALVPQSVEEMKDVYSTIETFLTGNAFIAGEHVTIADLSILATITTIVLIVPAPVEEYPKLNAWLDKCKSLPYYAEGNQPGLDLVEAFIRTKWVR